MKQTGNKNWEKHWNKLDESFVGKFFSFYRKNIIANAVAYYLDKYFPHKGTFVECGSGSSQTTIKLNKRNRKIIALDLSPAALKLAKEVKQIDECIVGDIFKLPFKDSSIDGIWNLGVMEHFEEKDIAKILSEFSRVLKEDSYAILFWPPKLGPVNLTLTSLESIAKVFGKNLDFFPDEISLLSKKIDLKKLAFEADFSKVEVKRSLRDLFTHAIVIFKK